MPRRKNTSPTDPTELIQSQARVEFPSACEHWKRIQEIRNVREFFSAFNLKDPKEGVEEADIAAAFLVSFFKLLGVPQQEAFYSWIHMKIRPTLYAWGITAPSPEIWSEDPEAIAATRRFFVAWAYGLCKDPKRKKSIPDFLVEAMKRENLIQW